MRSLSCILLSQVKTLGNTNMLSWHFMLKMLPAANANESVLRRHLTTHKQSRVQAKKAHGAVPKHRLATACIHSKRRRRRSCNTNNNKKSQATSGDSKNKSWGKKRTGRKLKHAGISEKKTKQGKKRRKTNKKTRRLT